MICKGLFTWLFLRMQVPVDKENVEQIATVLANVTGYYDSIQANGVGSVGSTMESIAAVASSSTRVRFHHCLHPPP